MPQACLTLDGWKEAVKNPLVLPAGLPGQALVSRGALAPEPSLFLASLDGSAEKGLVFGSGSLTTDGKKLVYSGENNQIFILNLETNYQTALETGGQNYRPIWSPDERQIAHSRYGDSAGLYVMNADGSEFRRVIGAEPGTNRPELSGWSPDSKELLYSVWSPEQGETALRLVNVESGVVRHLFTLKNPSPAVISPDGKWIAYLDHIDGKAAPGLFIARFDGTERRLLAQLDHWSIGGLIWSPDGQWLAMNVLNTDQFTAKSTIALLNVQTCQVVPLPNLNGSIQSWVLP